MEMKHPFIQFTPSFEDNCDCSDAVLPVVSGSDLRFPVPTEGLIHYVNPDIAIHQANNALFNDTGIIDESTTGNLTFFREIVSIHYISPSGAEIKRANFNRTGTIATLTDNLSSFLAAGDCFRLRITAPLANAARETREISYSNLFMYIGCEARNTLLFEYWSDPAIRHKIRLFAALNNPNPQTEKEEYTDANSFVHTIRKQRRKQLELEFGFYPEPVHDSIQEMLTFPNLRIAETYFSEDEDYQTDDAQYYESGDYRIDWENQDENGFAKASTQLSEQEVIRFSNCAGI